MARSLTQSLNEHPLTKAQVINLFVTEGTRLKAFVDAASARRPCDGPLAGLTFALKDMFDWAGRAPTCGLATAPGPTPPSDAALVTALLERGAVCSGFVEMTPLAYEASGGNFERARPINPLDASRITGGSSSGPAVAVAAGLVDFAVGSDTAGSLRIPAHCCGVAAWKPSLGLLPLAGAMKLAPSFDVPGFLARDMAMIARIAGSFLPPPAGHPPQIAVSSDLACANMTMMDGLAATFGWIPIALQPVIAACDPPMLALLQAEVARAHAGKLAVIKTDATFSRRISKGLAITDSDMQSACANIARLRAAAEAMLFTQADIILLPVMPIATPPVENCEPGSPTFSARTLYALAAYTRFASALGLPAVVIPAGRDSNGMPVGVQMIARHGADAALIAFATDLPMTLASRH